LNRTTAIAGSEVEFQSILTDPERGASQVRVVIILCATQIVPVRLGTCQSVIVEIDIIDLSQERGRSIEEGFVRQAGDTG